MRNISTIFSVFAVLGLAAACSEESSSPPPEEEQTLLEPPAEGQGIQINMVTKLEPGSEVEHCKFVKAPPEGLNVNRDEVRYSGGSHHVLVYMTQYDDIPTQDEQGRDVDTSGVFDCSEGVNFNWAIKSIVAGSQNSTGESVVKFPEDVAIRVPGNAVMLLNAHFINAAPDVVEPEVAVNLHTIPDEKVKYDGGMLFWYNPFIKVDAKGGGLATMSCPIPNDIHMENAQSHMHRRGVGYAATLIDGANQREVIYENTAWEGVPVEVWDPGRIVEGGSRIEFFCEYQNPEDRVVWQGGKTTDEMCMFIGSYWPASDEVSLCSSDPEDAVNGQSMAGEWVGQGEGTCGEALGCLQAIEDQSFDGFIQGLTECINATAPEESPWVSKGVSCLLTHADPVNDCAPEIQACLSHE